ncbi:unnamed protein product [Peniophora sp. CBMAI 1063]|nr:unnamed protein product [Peniophora sp. CBMAI 1063]
MFLPTILSSALVFFVALAGVNAEKHVVEFENKCGHGTPKLVSQNGKVLSNGGKYTHQGSLVGAIAFLQTGNCDANGGGCLFVETTLQNPDPNAPGSGSSTDLSLIPPHKFSVKTGFHYFNGCDGKGKVCAGQKCKTAFHKDTDTQVQVACQKKNVDLRITFCG